MRGASSRISRTPVPNPMARLQPTISRALRRGMTLTELIVAIGVMGLIAATLGTLALSVEVQGDHVQGTGDAVQHARVVLDRIQRNLRQATAAENYPAYLVVPQVNGTDSYPH